MASMRLAGMALALLALASALALGPAASAQTRNSPRGFPELEQSPAEASRYNRCLARARARPVEGFEDALAWRDVGGGDPARHCAAVALLFLGRPEEAGERLEQLGQAMRARAPELRAQVLGQAGQAWLEAGRPERAHAAISAALAINPDDVELWIDRSQALAAAQNYQEAIDDLTRALAIDAAQGGGGRADALAFRAAAHRYADDLDRAFADAERAVKLAPTLPEAWLERGILHRLRGDAPAARADWLRVLVLDGDGPSGDVARANIERLEHKLDDQPANRPAGRSPAGRPPAGRPEVPRDPRR